MIFRRLHKLGNAVVILTLLLQPVGTPGIWNIALAQSTDPIESVAEEPVVVKEDTATPPEAAVVSVSPEEETTPTPEVISVTEPAMVPPVEEPAPVVTTEPEVIVPAIEDVPTEISTTDEAISTEAPAEIPAETATEAPAEVSTEISEIAPAETPAIETEEAETSQEIPVETASIAPVVEPVATTVEPVVETETTCLSASAAASVVDDWAVDGDRAVTKSVVELGVRYVFPLDEEVTITFTCLPTELSKRAPLSIERIDVSDIDLPSGVVAVSEYAYDITTDGMENGSFKYDLSLPKMASGEADASYIEMSADEVKGRDLSKSDLKIVDEDQVDNKSESVEVTELDHFTVFVVTTSSGPVTFEITPDECSVDSAGVNDLSGQKDLTKLCQDEASSSTLNISWDWDDTSWTGNNSGDACALFDTDGDGLANYSLCVVVKGSPATYQSTRLYSCNDTKSDRCAGDSEISSFLSVCTAVVLNNEDPFSAGDNYPKDTVASCAINLADVGGVSTTQLLDVCSYPSQRPNSDPSDCVVFKTNSGKLEVKKSLSPLADPGLFNLQIDGVTEASNVTNGGSTGEKVVSVAIHTVGEVAGSNTTLSNYSASVECRNLNGTGSVIPTSGTGPWSLNVANESDIVCTITNTRINNGSLTIVKNAEPNGAQDFSFTTTGVGLSNFSLDDDADGALSNTQVFSNLAAGMYAVSETAVIGWTQTSATCDNGSPIDAISLEAGGNITCTFVNTRDAGSILVNKLVDTDGDGSYETGNSGANTLGFRWGLDAGAVTNTMGSTVSSIATGNHTVTENSIANYHFVGWFTTGSTQYSCSNPEGNTLPIDISVTKDVTRSITLCNARDTGTITVAKALNPTIDSGRFNLQVDGVTKVSDVGNGGTTDAITVVTGNHSVSEVAGTNTLLSDYNSSISCDNGHNGTGTTLSNVAVTKDANVTCTITNTRKTGLVAFEKIVSGGTAVPADWTFSVSGVAGTFASGSSVTLNTGVYTVTESGPANYTATGASGTCGSLSSSSATLTVTEQGGTCTFTNTRDMGNLKAVKTVDDGSNLTQWSFALDGGQPIQANAQGQVDFGQVTTGVTHIITESGPTSSYQLISVSGTNCARQGDSLSADATVEKGGATVCTFSNNVNKGSITVIKDTVPDDVQDFGFTVTGSGLTGFTLDDDGDNGNGVSNTKTFSGLLPGNYTVTESTASGWDLTALACVSDNQSLNVGSGNTASLTLSAGQSITCTFTNTKKGHLIVHKITDPADDTTEFSVTASGNGVITGDAARTISTVLDADYEVVPGTYKVAETPVAGWDETGNTCVDVAVAAGETKECTITNQKDAFIVVDKVTNPVGNRTAFGFTTNYDAPFSLADTDTPNNSGDLVPGTYSVTEAALDNWELTSAVCVSSQGDTEAADYISLQAGETVTCTFTNTQLTDLHGFKWHDRDGNRTIGDGEEKLAGWTIFIDENGNEVLDGEERNMVTSGSEDHFGWYWFDDLRPGTYSICEVSQTGWNQTYPVGYEDETEELTPICHSITVPTGRGTCQDIQSENAVVANQECSFGNQFVTPELIITKTNDKYPTTQLPGAVVTYTIQVTAPATNQSDLSDVTVTDLPPEGFEYLSGSAAASQGSLAHAYASPGVWSLGTMMPGQTITLSYQTTISSNQDPGLYQDLAWAKGTPAVGDDILAQDIPNADPSVDPTNATGDNYVGTRVAIDTPLPPTTVTLDVRTERDVDTKTVTRTKRVLGASTLPATGADTGWMLLALVFLLGGIGLTLWGRRREQQSASNSISRSMLKTFLFAFLTGILLFTGQAANAANPIVKIETPETPVANASLEIGFVTLDIDDRLLEAQCYKVAGPTAVPTQYVAKAGGNSGSCLIDGTVMPSDGIYQFYVVVSTGEEGPTVQSDTVTVELVSVAPSTPLNYSRAAGSCTVSFTTANDGLTDKVELYRSTETSFIATTPVTVSASIGPNVNGTLTDPNADCGGSYYYAIRAVAANSLGSAFVGDQGVTVEHENKVEYKTKTRKIAGEMTTTGAIPVTTTGAVTATEGTVEGAATTNEEAVSGGAGQEAGSVLGETTEETAGTAGGWIAWVKAHPWWSLLILLVLGALGYYGYGMYQEKKNHDESIR